MKSNICVPIPIKSADILEFKTRIEKVIEYNPDLIELRYDYINDPKLITKKFAKNLMDNITPRIPVIITFRNHNEGGQMKIKEIARFNIFKILVLSQPNYLDIEMSTEKKFLSELIDLANQNDVKLIFSHHNFKETPSYDHIEAQIQEFLKKLKLEFGFNSGMLEKTILKLIFKANSFRDNLILLKLCKEFSENKINIISFCMGNLGIYSRILCVLNGSYLTYGSIVEETAPGQPKINDIREALSLFLE
jgi:3-dehydroquinate dehydratase type I